MFAEFETNLRRERQMEGIAKAKAAGVYKPSELPGPIAVVHAAFSALDQPVPNVELDAQRATPA